MLTLLSPAKRLDFDAWDQGLPVTKPRLQSESKELLPILKELSPKDLIGLMGISDSLAELNVQRFSEMKFPHTKKNAKPAALAFKGDVYLGLEAETLSPEDLDFAQGQVRILSGLYGVLRPLDLIQPYRLEMGTSLKNPRGKDLYQFWGELLTQRLKQDLRGHTHKVVVNLASNEYASAVQLKDLGVPVVTPVFQEVKGGKARVLSFFAKKARGIMARWMVTQRLEAPESLEGFQEDGYELFDKDEKKGRWIYRRPQPPPVNG